MPFLILGTDGMIVYFSELGMASFFRAGVLENTVPSGQLRAIAKSFGARAELGAISGRTGPKPATRFARNFGAQFRQLWSEERPLTSLSQRHLIMHYPQDTITTTQKMILLITNNLGSINTSSIR